MNFIEAVKAVNKGYKIHRYCGIEDGKKYYAELSVFDEGLSVFFTDSPDECCIGVDEVLSKGWRKYK